MIQQENTIASPLNSKKQTSQEDVSFLPLVPLIVWQVALGISIIFYSSSLVFSPIYESGWRIVGWFMLPLSVAGLVGFIFWVLPSKKRRANYVKGHTKHGMFQQDFIVWNFFYKHPVVPCFLILFSILASVSLPITFVITITNLPFGPDATYLLSIFLASFVAISLFNVGFLLVAEYLQLHILKQKRPSLVIDLIVDYIHALPMIFLMSILWVLYAVVASVSREKSKKSVLAVVHTAIVVLKYYTFTNLSLVAVREMRGLKSFSEAAQFMRSNYRSFIMIWFRKGITILPVFLFLAFGLWGWSEALPQWQATMQLAAVVSIAVLLLLTLALEQMAFLLHVIGKRFHFTSGQFEFAARTTAAGVVATNIMRQ